MNTPRTPQFLIDFGKWISRSLQFNRSRHVGTGNHKQRRRFARAKMCVQSAGDVIGNRISRDRMVTLIRRDAQRRLSFEEAVRTGYQAKIARVKAGLGKNTLSGIPFANL